MSMTSDEYRFHMESYYAIMRRINWMTIAQTYVTTKQPQGRGASLPAQILTELACVPDQAIPTGPDQMYQMISDYHDYALGKAPCPPWYKDEWISKDW